MRIRVQVKANARTSALTSPGADGVWRAQLKSPPVDGKANAELIALIAQRFGCGRSRVAIRGGAGGRIKWVEVG